MKAKRIILCVAVVFLAGILAYSAIQRKHNFTLSNEDGGVKAEQIQPVFGTVKVSGDMDTDVVFTDVETGEKYTIGYITHGMTDIPIKPFLSENADFFILFFTGIGF